FEAEDDVFDNHFDFSHINMPSPEPRTPYNPNNPPDPPALPLNRLANQDCLESLPPPVSPLNQIRQSSGAPGSAICAIARLGEARENQSSGAFP
ncbi:hypothetical protein FRC11_002090, partial [Ceratobasidium sp. 423]